MWPHGGSTAYVSGVQGSLFLASMCVCEGCLSCGVHELSDTTAIPSLLLAFAMQKCY
jgi:hypothetical protein